MAEPPNRFAEKTIAALTRAIYQGETEKALALIRPGLPFDHVARDVSHTPLLAAIENGNMAVFEALLAAGAGIGASTELGDTPLHTAARKGNEAMVSALVARGADVAAPIHRPRHQYHGRTPLMEAALGRNLAVVKLLLARGADPFAKDVSGWTAMSFAEVGGKRIANHLRKLMNATPQAAEVGLLDAARTGLTERVRLLLDGGEAVDGRDEFGRTALHQAVMGGHAEIVRLLLERGAAADAADKRGSTPLSLVEDQAEIAKVLLEHGADPNADIGGGITVLLAAAMFRPPEVLALLIDAGGDLQAKTPDGQGILDHARGNGPRARKFLKERMGVAPNAFDALQEHMKALPTLAKADAFQAAAARLGRLFNRRPAPWKRRKGVVYFHDVSLTKYLAPALRRGRGEGARRGGSGLAPADAAAGRAAGRGLRARLHPCVPGGGPHPADSAADGRQICGAAGLRHQRHQQGARHRDGDRLAARDGGGEPVPARRLRP
jgi:ankyrin repeat protein